MDNVKVESVNDTSTNLKTTKTARLDGDAQGQVEFPRWALCIFNASTIF